MELLNIKDIHNFITPFYRAPRIDWHFINSFIVDIINPDNGRTTIDLSIINRGKAENRGEVIIENINTLKVHGATARWAMNTEGRCMQL